VALRRLGVGLLYLGPDVPVASWVHAVERDRAQVIIMPVVQTSDRPAALDVAAALRRLRPRPVVAVGGRSADWDAAREAGIVVLPDRINDASVAAARLLNATP
jgi:methanogenic corrinoid protein MtbC1